MRTLSPPMLDQSSPSNARCASNAAAMASATLKNAAQNASPMVLKTLPLCAWIAERISSSCRRTLARMASRCRSQRSVEPSMSLKRKVTVPVGSGLRWAIASDTQGLLDCILFGQRGALSHLVFDFSNGQLLANRVEQLLVLASLVYFATVCRTTEGSLGKPNKFNRSLGTARHRRDHGKVLQNYPDLDFSVSSAGEAKRLPRILPSLFKLLQRDMVRCQVSKVDCDVALVLETLVPSYRLTGVCDCVEHITL